VPLLQDRNVLRPLLEHGGARTASVRNLVFGLAGARARWVRVDRQERPRAVLCRGRRLYLWAASAPAARAALSGLPDRTRCNFSATPDRLVRACRAHFAVRRQAARTWTNRCWLYELAADAPPVVRGVRVEPLLPRDAVTIARLWPHGRRVDYVRARIRAWPSCAVRVSGRLAGWGLTHDDGSMGFLRVLEECRGRGLARAITATLVRRLLDLGVRPHLYIMQDNEASIRLTESCGFRRVEGYTWFGEGRRRAWLLSRSRTRPAPSALSTR
jgi:8-oxo-dGTP diphosphatase